MDDGSPALEVGFAINPEGSFETLRQLQAAMDTAEARIVADAAQIERATGGMVSLGGATAQITSFGNAASRELASAAREMARAEKSGEALSRQLDRQSATFGKSREELRHMKVETAALAAEQQGLTELAGRLRAQEQAIYDQEFSAMRQASGQANALAEDKAEAARRAVAAAEAEATAVREAAWAYQMFEARVRDGAKAMREMEAAQKAVDRDTSAAKLRVEADAAARLAQEHQRLAAVVRGSQAAQEADAVAAERLRMSTDPLYAATKRLNDEIAESTRLYHAGVTAQGEYERQQSVLTGRLAGVTRQSDLVNNAIGGIGTNGKLAGHHVQNLAFQFQDLSLGFGSALASSEPVKMMLMTLAQQGFQIQGIMSQAGIGIRGVGAAFLDMSKSVLLATVTNPVLMGIAAAAALAAGAIKLMQSAANDGQDMKAYAASLGLTEKEIRNLDNVTVTFGDTTKAVFQVAGAAIWGAIGPAVTQVWDVMKEWATWIGSGVKDAVNFMIGGFVGAYNAITKSWRMFPAVMGDVFYSAVNASVGAINTLVQKAVDGLNSFITASNMVLDKVGLGLPKLTAPQIAAAKNEYAGAGAEFGKTLQDEVKKAMGKDYLGNLASGVSGAVSAQARKNALDRIRADALEKGYLDPETAKTDKHAEKLARDAEAIEAQIRNLYALADAYGVSGAAAMVAEARVKAESAAIKQRADIEAAVDRQIRLAVAQRVSDAAKATAAAREQVAAQRDINAMVAAGLAPAEQAADLIRDRIADLPLLAAIEVAQQRGLADEVRKSTRQLEDQRKVRAELRKEEATAKYQTAMFAGDDRLAELREELRLVGATDDVRVRALTTLKATRDAKLLTDDPEQQANYVKMQVAIAVETQKVADATARLNDELSFAADSWDLIANNVQNAARGMADAFGDVGRAIGDMASIYAGYHADRARLDLQHQENIRKAGDDQAAIDRANARFALATATSQIGLYGDMTSAAKGFFKEGSSGYKALETAEKAFRAVEFALSVRAMVQDATETASSVAKSGFRTATKAVEAVVSAIASLPFPLNIAAGAATIAALAAIGVSVAGSFGGGKNTLPKANEGTGTVLGDAEAKSESIKRAIDSLKEVDTLMLGTSREMAASLRSIESQIGGFAALLVRSGDINASDGVSQGFKPNAIGSILGSVPLVGGILKSLFGTKTSVVGSGLFGGAQSLQDILAGGYDADYYSDVKKQKKFFGLTTSTKYSTQYSDAAPELENQFTLILRQFNDAIIAAAGPLGAATGEIQDRLNGFVVNIGKIDLQGLTGEEIEEKLSAVFGAAADDMARAAFPGIERFQEVGEGLFETLVRVASTVESVTSSLTMLGSSASLMSVDMKMSLADQFDSIGDFTNAVDGYFETYYSKAEQAAARTAQFASVFGTLGLVMPDTLAGFRSLVEAQDLTTAAGQATYATLLQLAPAFAELQSAMNGAKSAADILSERQDLERKLLELQGDTQAIRELDLAKLDESNRALQEQIWAIQDAKEAADAAKQLKDAWTSVGDSIMDEVNRIRGLTDAASGGSFASLMGQFNAATTAARGGDQDAASSLPALSQALLQAADLAATSRQELDRIQAQTAASLAETYAAIMAGGGSGNAGGSPVGVATGVGAPTGTILSNAAAAAQLSATAPSANDDLAQEIKSLREEVAQMRNDNNAGHAATAGNTGAIKRKLEDVTAASGGQAVSVAGVAA